MNELTITILTPKKRIGEAEEIFLNLVDKKEKQKDWECIEHRVFKRNDLMNRIYVFQNMKNDDVHILELFEHNFQSIQGRKFDNVIYLDSMLTEEVKARTLGKIIIL